jgi:hypothetical protein
MIESQLLGVVSLAAILTGKLVPQEQMVPGKRDLLAFPVPLERDDCGDFEGLVGGMDQDVFIGLDLNDPVLDHGDESVLPIPDGEGGPAQGLEVRIENESSEVGDGNVHPRIPTPICDVAGIGTGEVEVPIRASAVSSTAAGAARENLEASEGRLREGLNFGPER